MNIDDINNALRESINRMLEEQVIFYLQQHPYANYFMFTNLVIGQTPPHNIIILIKNNGAITIGHILNQFHRQGIDHCELSPDYTEMQCMSAHTNERFVLVDYSNGVIGG